MNWIEAAAVQPGMAVVDIGANHGLYTSNLASAVGPTGTVIAIEPQPNLHPRLQAIAPQVRTLPYAMGQTGGMVLLHLSERPEHASLYLPNVLAPVGASLPVLRATLDDLQARGEIPTPIHAIKIDAQGSEMAILRGAVEMLRTQRPALYLEIWPLGLAHAGHSVQELCGALDEWGYAPYQRTWADVLAAADRCSGHGSDDVLFLSTEKSDT